MNTFSSVFSHKKYPGRCAKCFMREEVCICAELPVIRNNTPLSIIVHQREIYKTTNTARLAHLSLTNTRVFVRGRADQRSSTDLTELHLPSHQSVLLTLSDESQTLTKEFSQQFDKPIHLIVPDGSWRQANKMKDREKALAGIPWVKLPPGAPSVYRLRREHHPEGLATIEAIARAMGILEGPNVQHQLEQIFQLMVERTMSTRPPVNRTSVLTST